MSIVRKPTRFFEDRSGYRSRPREYEPELADTIIDMVSCGELLSDICLDRDMPLPSTFLRWCDEDDKLRERYVKAQEYGAEVSFDEATSVAFDSDVARGSVRWRALMTRAERMMPDKYGPRATLRQTKEVEDAAAGIDYASEVRRRFNAMAERLGADAPPAAESGSSDSA